MQVDTNSSVLLIRTASCFLNIRARFDRERERKGERERTQGQLSNWKAAANCSGYRSRSLLRPVKRPWQPTASHADRNLPLAAPTTASCRSLSFLAITMGRVRNYFYKNHLHGYWKLRRNTSLIMGHDSYFKDLTSKHLDHVFGARFFSSHKDCFHYISFRPHHHITFWRKYFTNPLSSTLCRERGFWWLFRVSF